MERLWVCSSSNFISKQSPVPSIVVLEGQSHLPLEAAHVYCKWCVNSFGLENRMMQALLCLFTRVCWPNSNPCNCFPQVLTPLWFRFQLGWSARCSCTPVCPAFHSGWDLLLCAMKQQSGQPPRVASVYSPSKGIPEDAFMWAALRSKAAYQWQCLRLLPPSTERKPRFWATE